MSQENVEIARRAFEFEIYGRGEAAAIFDPDVVMKPLEEEAVCGVGSMRDNFEHWKGAWDALEVTADEVIDGGDRVLICAHHQARGRGSGIEIDAWFYEVYTLRRGKVVRVDEFAARAEAMKAAGLEE
jgi:ketosteroid isomerase-like protein